MKIFENKWIQLVIFAVALLLTANVFYGWQQYQLLLAKGGAYAWLCPDGYDFEAEGNIMCDAQQKAVERLYTIATGCEYVSCIFGGIFLDHLGPRESAMIGESLNLIGNILLMFSTHSFNAYIPAMVFLGLSGNIIAFPAFVLGELFPGFNAIAGAVILAGQDACTVIAPIMWAIWKANDSWSFVDIQLGYLLICWLPFVTLYFMALPNKREIHKKLDEIKREIELAEQNKRALKKEVEDQAAVIATTENGKRMSVVDTISESVSVDSDSAKIHDDKIDSSSISGSHSSVAAKDVDLAYEQNLQIQEKASMRQVWRDMMTQEFIFFGIFYVVQMLQNSYFFANVRPALGADVSDFVGFFMPTQAIWALVGGFALEFLGTAAIMHVLAIGVGICLIICTVPGIKGLQYASAAWMVIQNATIFTAGYSIVSEVFEKFHFGKLAGMYGLLGGLFTFLNIPISDSTDYDFWFWFFAAWTIPLTAIASYILWRQRKGKAAYRLDPYETRIPWSLRVGKGGLDVENLKRQHDAMQAKPHDRLPHDEEDYGCGVPVKIVEESPTAKHTTTHMSAEVANASDNHLGVVPQRRDDNGEHVDDDYVLVSTREVEIA